uniref:Uncharacterized protein n=1 Tax=Triticum urartu TaxID=4572 RepID=A0A8R7TFU5_TRIUA
MEGASGTSYVGMNHQLKGVIGKYFVECNGKAKNDTPWRSNSKIRQEQSDGTSLLRVGVHQVASLPAASNLTHVYGAYVPENSNGSDHTYEGNQVGLDAPFIRNVDENYPSSPGRSDMQGEGN